MSTIDLYDDLGSLERGFISKEDILSKVTEEQIFELVFGFQPVELEYTTSPFRKDNNPGCWFEKDLVSDKLWFKDHSTNITVNGVRLKIMDCFNAVQVYFEIPNFYKTLQFIKERLIDGRNLETIKREPREIDNRIVTKRERSKILIATRNFQEKDKRFWYNDYGITKEQLIEDEVFPVSKHKIISPKKGTFIEKDLSLCYAYTEFEGKRKKLYRPLKKGRHRFLSTAIANDVGGYKRLVPFGRQLVITKSYKDCRVLKNIGLNVIWFQSESTVPSEDILKDLCKRFKTIVIFYDNDDAGKSGAKKLKAILNPLLPGKIRMIYIPDYYIKFGIKDPSDLLREKGQEILLKFLKELQVL